MLDKTTSRDDNEQSSVSESCRQDCDDLSPSVESSNVWDLKNHPDWELIGTVGPLKIVTLLRCPSD